MRVLLCLPAAKGRDGNLSFSLQDPDGNRLVFVQYQRGSLHSKTRGKPLGERRLSDHLWHAGVTVADLDRANAFYRDKLGFKETWRGGATDTDLRWVNMQMSGPRGDY
ncbi:MAG: VOC family protein, partial [Acidobacteriota bacterium]